MSNKTDQIHAQVKQQLRASAEAYIVKGKSLAEATLEATLSVDNLLHELHVHQIELEIQNDELRRTQHILEASRAHYAELYDFAPVAYLSLNAEGLITELNFTAEKLLGVGRKHLILRRFTRFIADVEMDRWYLQFKRMKNNAQGKKYSFDMQLLSGNNALFYGHFDCQLGKNDDTSLNIRIALTDITPLKKVESLRLSAIAFEMQNAIIVTDANRVIIHVNQAFSRIMGYSAQETLGQKSSFFRSGQHDELFYEKLWATVATKGHWQGEMMDRHKHGKIFPAWHTVTAVTDTDGINTHYVSSFMDITDQKDKVEQLEQLAFYDQLTNLPNRRLLKDRLHLALAHSTRSKQYGVLLFIDLDNFKNLNDTLGHKAGDVLLQQVARRLTRCIREDDTAARLGGDEFVVMMEDLGANSEDAVVNAVIAGNKILAALTERYQFAHQDYYCSASIGASLFYSHTVAEDNLLKHVDIAMYQAKNTGRNKLCFFDASMQAILMERATLEADLRRAVQENHFKLYYQLQVAYDGRIVGAEALLRWQHPTRGLVLPSAFIPLAEETGLMLSIGYWVMETACAQLKIWQNQPHTRHLQLAVNVSANRFQQPDMVRDLQDILEKTAIDPSRLKLELTESLLIKDVEDTITKMHGLKALGVSLSLDDFGTGYSSLSYLTQLPLDQLKIDQSFVRSIGVKNTDAVIVSTIIAMAKSLNMEVIAEGVETEAQREFLYQQGCLLYQGYLFSKPVPLSEFEALLGLEGLLHALSASKNSGMRCSSQ